MTSIYFGIKNEIRHKTHRRKIGINGAKIRTGRIKMRGSHISCYAWDENNSCLLAERL